MSLTAEDLQAIKQIIEESTSQLESNIDGKIDKLREDSEKSFTGFARMFEERETRLMGKMDDVLTQSSETYQEQLFSGNQTRENKKELEELDRRVKVLEGQQSLI